MNKIKLFFSIVSIFIFLGTNLHANEEINVLKEEIKNTDFSFLSDTANEKVEAEKIKIYEEIIHKCK